MPILHPQKTLVGALLIGTVGMVALGTAPLAAQEADRPAGPPAGGASVSAAPPRMTAHPTDGAIEVDGRLDEPVWSRVPARASFVQKEPVEGAPAVNDSEVWVLFDEQAIYIGAILRDESPGTIARNMVRRDSNYNGQFDYFEVLLDPNLDRRTGYRFRVSAANVQADRYLYEDVREDAAWNAVWASAVTVDERGWIVEMRIPLSQLRYETSTGVQTWGINFGRRRAADNELTRLALESKLVRGRVSQFGLVDGLSFEGSPRRLEVRPYVLTSAHRGPALPGNPYFDGRETDAVGGLEMRYGLGPSFTLDATLNPDFGQVEADPAVINLTAFETFFPEQRPFFVEDARVFDFSLSGGRNSLFYSRRIGRTPHQQGLGGAAFVQVPETSSIIGAAKLTGRTQGGLSVGALFAVTEQEEGVGRLDTGIDSTFIAEPRVGYGVLRLAQDLNEGRTKLGGILTYHQRDLPPDGSFDRLTSTAVSAGVDFEHNFGDRTWALWGFLGGSHILGDSTAITRIQRASNHYLQRPDLEWGALDPTATAMSGAEWRLQFERRRGHVQGSVWAAQVTSGFEVNDLGFSTASERLDGGARVQYIEVTPGDWYRNYSAGIMTFQNFSHEVLHDVWSLDRWDWAQTGGTINADGNLQFQNFWTVRGSAGYRPETMSRTHTRGGPRMINPSVWFASASVATDNRKVVSFRPSVTGAVGALDSGYQVVFGLGTTIQPSTRLEIHLEPRFSSQRAAHQYVSTLPDWGYDPTYGDAYFFGNLDQRNFSMITRLNWTFTPQFTLQLFAQPLVASGDYLNYRQLAEAETFSFIEFPEGESVALEDGSPGCVGGTSCLDEDGIRHLDLNGDGSADHSFVDRDFNVRSLRATAVLRWEYRPGSTIFLVWQHRQSESLSDGGFDLGRDLTDLFAAASDDVFMVKVNLWLSF